MIDKRKPYAPHVHASIGGENLLSSVLDALPQVIWTNSGAGTADYFNRRWYEYTGLSFDESFARGWEAVVHPDDREMAEAKWERAKEAVAVFDTEYRLRGADGEYRWFLGRNVPVVDADGRIIAWFGTATDIEDRVIAEASIKASREQLHRAIEEAPVPVIMHADNGEILQLSKTWTESTGFTADDLTTFDDWVRRVGGSHAENVITQIHWLLDSKRERVSTDFDMTTQAGDRRRWSYSASSPGTLEDGRHFIVGMALDITEREQAEEALRRSLEETERARSEAEASGKAKDHFLSVLSHELRTPLTPILFALDILALSQDLSPKLLPMLEMIRRNVRLEAALIDDLLEITRIRQGKLEIEFRPLDLHAIVQDALTVTATDRDQKTQHVTLALDAEEHEILGDHARLQQVVRNLLVNASKFSPPDSVIHVATRNEPGAFLVEIKDNGIGIDTDAVSQIFDAFSQANEAITRQFGGLGLGLAIAKATVEAHGGGIYAESAGTGQGATFSIRLPLADRS